MNEQRKENRTMDNWVITLNTIDNGSSLFCGYEAITGKNILDALQNRFGVPFRRMAGEEGRYAEIILVKGTLSDCGGYPQIRYSGKYQQLCYGRQDIT
jgi:hypothetical protein